MRKSPTEIPRTAIISNTWEPSAIKAFLRRLNKGSIFGYSEAFSYDQIVHTARVCGVVVSTLPVNSTLYKKYGEYILKVITPFDPTILTPHKHTGATYTSIEQIHHYKITHTKGKRKCKNCEEVIDKGDPVMEITKLVEIYNGNKGYKKESYHLPCAASHIKGRISYLLNMMPVGERVRNKNSKLVENLIDKVYSI